MKTRLSVLVLFLALLAGGCGGSDQKAAYENAVKREQNFSAERAGAIIAEYQKVIRLEPGSKWAGQAQARIEAVQARAKAEETKKAVLQEHGID